MSVEMEALATEIRSDAALRMMSRNRMAMRIRRQETEMVNVLEKSELPSSNPTITYNTYNTTSTYIMY
jgi:tRNA(Ile2) C34 agmatinyltransferase TiaS